MDNLHGHKFEWTETWDQQTIWIQLAGNTNNLTDLNEAKANPCPSEPPLPQPLLTLSFLPYPLITPLRGIASTDWYSARNTPRPNYHPLPRILDSSTCSIPLPPIHPFLLFSNIDRIYFEAIKIAVEHRCADHKFRLKYSSEIFENARIYSVTRIFSFLNKEISMIMNNVVDE